MTLKYLPSDPIEKRINQVIKEQSENKKIDTNLVSDGYHTFGELYEHRITLYIALCKMIHDKHEHSLRVWHSPSPVWRTRVHSDGSVMKGWFLLGINREAGKQITYHLPDSKWLECEFAEIIEDAPEFDGHTSEDVLNRIKLMIKLM